MIYMESKNQELSTRHLNYTKVVGWTDEWATGCRIEKYQHLQWLSILDVTKTFYFVDNIFRFVVISKYCFIEECFQLLATNQLWEQMLAIARKNYIYTRREQTSIAYVSMMIQQTFVPLHLCSLITTCKLLEFCSEIIIQ